MIVSANNQQNNQTPHTTYSINGILGIDGDRKVRKGGTNHHISDHHQLSPNGVVELDVSDLKRRPSTGLNSGISQYNGLNNENLYLSWSQGAPYGDTPDSVHPPPHHYESTTLYTPPTLGTFLCTGILSNKLLTFSSMYNRRTITGIRESGAILRTPFGNCGISFLSAGKCAHLSVAEKLGI